MPYKATKKHLKSMKEELKKHDFRVSIFGSARKKPEEIAYQNAFNLAAEIAKKGYDVVTGGGPGIMEAANAGHQSKDKSHKSDSIGLTIQLPFEAKGNNFLEIREHFPDFSNRLARFVQLSNVFVIMPGGIGTCLELFYVWQLIQVKHIPTLPIILYGEMWEKLLKWVKTNLIGDGLISPGDCDWVHVVKNTKQAMEIIEKEHKKWKK